MDDRERQQKRIDEAAAERERRKWLLSVREEDAGRLAVPDWYDRLRYLRAIEGERLALEARINVSCGTTGRDRDG